MVDHTYPDRFSPAVTEKIGYYVYALVDPREGEAFYIGKGTGNRVFEHLRFALKSGKSSLKLDQIRAIRDAGQEVGHVIVRHGLTEKEALEVEAALIDFVGLRDLANKVKGHHASDRGLMNSADIIATYDAQPVTIREPALLIIVNRLYYHGIEQDDLYDITRGDWVVGKRREKARFAFAVYNGIVRQVYRIDSWAPIVSRRRDHKTLNRWRFSGVVADEMAHYVGGVVEQYIKKGSRSPVRYLNC